MGLCTQLKYDGPKRPTCTAPVLFWYMCAEVGVLNSHATER